MTGEFAYDPDDYLISTMRSLENYLLSVLQASPDVGEDIKVEMSYPDTREWTKTSPLAVPIVHFELDDDPAIILGFGTPLNVVEQDDDTVLLSEPHLHLLNFDIGIWTDPNTGGTTKRAQIRNILVNALGTSTGKQAFTDQTSGVKVASYGGGNDVLDRINDLPVYRTVQLTLMLSVFGRYQLPDSVPMILEIDQREKLSIVSDDGMLEHVETDEGSWT